MLLYLESSSHKQIKESRQDPQAEGLWSMDSGLTSDQAKTYIKYTQKILHPPPPPKKIKLKQFLSYNANHNFLNIAASVFIDCLPC